MRYLRWLWLFIPVAILAEVLKWNVIVIFIA